MSSLFPPEIRKGLLLLRSRIRRIRLFRGLLRTLSIALAGALVIVSLDYLLAPLPSLVRAGLFFAWLGAIALSVVWFLVLPLMEKLPLVRLARWLEDRHPELQERISTSLELADHSEGISPALLRELSEEAAADMGSVDPRAEIQTKRIRGAIWPAAASLLAMVALLVIWPQEMGRLLTRVVRPFSDLGNAGAFRFAVTPGDLEVLEGDEFTIELVYSGELPESLELVMEKDGKQVVEPLQPTESEGESHRYAYTVYEAESDFRYSARVARNESDRFEVTVYPVPRLLEPQVTLQFPTYTGWKDRKISLGNGVRALAGTEVTLTGRLDTPVLEGEMHFEDEAFGEFSLERNSGGTEVTWRGILQPGQDGPATLSVMHRLEREFEAAKFAWFANDDPAPEVRLLSPLKREFRLKPDDEVTMTYDVVEAIGLSRAEIELEVNGSEVDSLREVLPLRLNPEDGERWAGEARVSLATLVSRHPKARVFRMRLALSDNRPPELEGPGVGHSEWLEITLDGNADSMARQKLRNEEADLRKTVEEVVKKVNEAQKKMNDARRRMKDEEEVSKWAEEDLAKAREKLKEAQSELSDLSERMEAGVQAHRRDEVAKAQEKLSEARKAVENAPLQDTPQARREEVDHALRESEEAIRDLEKLKQEVERDRPKIDDLAKLQEMARKQDNLATEAASEAPAEDWEQRQRDMREEIRNEVKQSPEAKAAAIRAQAEQALDLAKKADDLREVQEELAGVSEEVGRSTATLDESQIAEALVEEQEKAFDDAREELAEARRDQEKERARDLDQAARQSEQAAQKARQEKPAEAAQAAREAAQKMAERAAESPTQKSLADKQEKLSNAFEALAEGRTEEARDALEELRNEPTLREVGKALAKAQEEAVKEAREEWQDAKKQKEEGRAEGLAEALEEARQASEEARQNHPKQAAEAARKAAEELAQDDQKPATQKALQAKQEKLAEAFEALAEGHAGKALEALNEAAVVPDPDQVAEALAGAQKALSEATEKEKKVAQMAGEERANNLDEAAKEAGQAAQKAQQNKPAEAAQAAQKAAEELSRGADRSPVQESLQKQQESLAEAFEALSEGELAEASEALGEMQSERLNDALGRALSKEQEAVVEAAREELREAREARDPRANDLPEALAQAQAALEQARQGETAIAAKAAEAAASELSKGSESSASQQQLQERQEGIAEALQDLAEGNPAEALAALQAMQGARAEDLASAIREVAPVEGNPLSEAGQLANGGAQKAQAASQAQQSGESGQAAQEHQSAAEQFERARQSLEKASQQMDRQAQQAAGEKPNPNQAPAPGEPMAEALQRSSQAAQASQAGRSQEAAEEARSAAEALREAAQEAKSQMQQGNKPGDAMAQGDQPGEGEGGESPPSQEAKEGVRQAEGDKGVPPELAKLGINVDDWEKIQATLKTDVGGSDGGTIPEDYRGLVKKYFEQISKKQ